MDNPTGNVSDTSHARSVTVGKRFDLGGRFGFQMAGAAALVAAVLAIGWLLLAGPSDQERIDDQLAEFDVTATYVGEADDGGFLYDITRDCGEDLTVTIELGDTNLDGPTPILLAQGSEAPVELTRQNRLDFIEC